MYKKIFLLLALLSLTSGLAFAEEPQLSFTEATDLTLLGKVFPDTPNPYERMDFERFGGWEEKDISLLEMSSGVVVSFKTCGKKYKDVYYIPSNATSAMHETTLDGVHPGEWGYYLWAESVRQPILDILKQYGID